MIRLLAFLIILTVSWIGWAKDSPKGVIKELQIKAGDNEDENQKKAVQSEVLIAKTEQKAIETLQLIIKKKKGAPEEADLWFRLGELYMRRAKAGRFFDLNRENNKAVSFAPPQLIAESAQKHLRKSMEIYKRIEKEFPKYSNLDAVLFNLAFSLQQLNDLKSAQDYYLKVIDKFPKSPLIPDSHLAVGEMNYNAQRFNMAIVHFLAIETFPQSKVYSYGIYKAAWSYYNLQKTEEGIDKLLQVALYFHPDSENAKKTKPQYNLRPEALRDLTIFFSDKRAPEEAFPFFVKVCTDEELGEAMVTLGKIYNSHSRYKDINNFMPEFIKKRPENIGNVKAHLLLVEINETLKNRKEVVAQLRATAEVCDVKSKWRKKFPEKALEDCDVEFAQDNLEIAKKWWEIWLKNKHHMEFADLTQEAFKIYLEREDPKKPDPKSRYAFAELLFQRENYRDSSKNYEQASLNTLDPLLLHDCTYGALVALEKAQSVKADKKDPEELLRLSQNYLEKNPKGQYLHQVRFKIAYLHFLAKRSDDSEKWLKALIAETKPHEFKRKSEDLLLEIYNDRKAYLDITKLCADLIKVSKDKDRLAGLSKILEEADFAHIQSLAKTDQPMESSGRLKQFYFDHPHSNLAKDALWQSLSLAYSAGNLLEGADLSVAYYRRFPQDKKALEAFREAAKSYSEVGYLDIAASSLEEIALLVEEKERPQLQETAADFLLLDGKLKEARALYEKLLTSKQNSAQSGLYSKVLATMKGQENTPDYIKLENRILQFNVEPYASEIQLKRLKLLMVNKKYNDAFNTAKNLVGSGATEDIRADARMIQAQILEQELFQQSMKTGLDRLPTVLSIKTDKLDKAQTAYMNAAKMAKDPQIQIKALEGLNRCYENYVQSVSVDNIKGEFQEEEKKALAEELAKITAPFKKKADETKARLTELNGPPVSAAGVRIPAQQKTPEPYLPNFNTEEDLSKFARAESLSPLCKNTEFEKVTGLMTLNERINMCLLANKTDTAVKWMDRLSRIAPKSPITTFYWSIIAERKGLIDKALFLIELSIKKDDELSFLHFQKGRLLMSKGEIFSAKESFKKARKLKLVTPDAESFAFFQLFLQGDGV